MGFLEAYKHLERLCGDILNEERPISAYIEEMKNTPRGAFMISDWDDDLKNLEYYRRIRNKITHEPGCTEENMCDPEDTLWLEDFYERIINQTDPITLYRKATQPIQIQSDHTGRRKKRKYMICGIISLLAVVIIMAIVLLFLKKFML